MIMFIPHASPVVYAYMTWHMGPTTCVSISRSFACLERLAIGSDAQPVAHVLELGLDPACERRPPVPTSSKRNAEARVIRSPST